MPCASPLTQYYNPKDGTWDFKKRAISRIYPERQLDCGVCIECRVRKSREWAIRCYHEQKMHRENSWLTLSYESNPVTLRREDIRVFVKSLRNAGYRFRYFGCGEYGEQTLRPHYHLCIFGLNFPDRYAWKNNHGNILYRSQTLEKYWLHGNSWIGEITDQSAKYTAGYTYKKLNGKARDELDPDTGLKPYERITVDGEIVDVIPEQLFVSNRPGIGHDWFMNYYQEVYPANHVVMNGREYPPPKYYDKLCAKYFPELWEKAHEKRLQHIKENPLTDDDRSRIHEARKAHRKSKRPRSGV
ncbi:MAG: putative replication initiation protein [Microviridae sp.]|nr:MAG: putative replication initiation protein [Microviridae sp.]